MKRIVLIVFFISLAKLFTLFEVINFGEPVKFGNGIYLVTNENGTRLVAQKIIQF